MAHPARESAQPVGVARPRQAWVDVVRGVAVLLVVFYHSVIALPVAGLTASTWLGGLNDGLAPFRMPMLVFLSGLFLERALVKPWPTYLESKTKVLLWPWLVWTLVTVAVFWAGSTFAGDGDFGVGSALRLAVDPRMYTWYLWTLFVFFVLARLVPRAAYAACVVVLVLVSAVVPEVAGLDRFLFLLAFFVGGSLAMRYVDQWHRVLTRPVTWIAAAAGVTMLVAGAVGMDLRYSLWSVVGIGGTLVALVPLGTWLASRSVGMLLARAGRDSLTYYVTHWPVVTVGVNVVARTRFDSPTWTVVLLVAAGLALSAAAVRLRAASRLVDRCYVLPTRSDRAQSSATTEAA